MDNQRCSTQYQTWRRLGLAVLLGALLLVTGRLLLTPAYAQSENGISEPASGDSIAGVVSIVGTATHPEFLSYDLAFRPEGDPGGEWIVFATGDLPVVAGTLAIWDTTVGRNIGTPVFPDGRYQLRLRVIRTDYNYDEFFISNLTISNDEPTPTPTAAVTETVATRTPLPLATIVTAGDGTLPTLTPFPTPPPQPTPVNESRGSAAAATPAPGLRDQVATIDTQQFGRAFWQGVRLAGIAFVVLLAYLLLRGVLRRLWRQVLNRVLPPS